MNGEPDHKHRKYWIFAILALLVAFIAYAVADEALNQEIAFEYVGNNTDLCDFNHVSMTCNGTRQLDIVYWANESPIVLNVFAHANSAGQTAAVFIYRNGVLYAPQAGRPLAAPEQTWRDPGSVIIPKGWNYSVNVTNYHHFEWREDKILSGRNGTLLINITNITNIISSGGGGVSFNGSPVNLNGTNLFNGTISNYSTLAYTNSSLDLKVNKSGDTMTGSIFENRGGLNIGSLSFADLAGVGQPGRIVSFFGINRIFNESTLTWSNSSYPEKNGMAAVFDNQGATPPIFQLASFLPNSTSYTYWFSSSRDMTTVLKGNLTITNQSGAGNVYACIDSNGKIYRGNPGC